MALLNVNYYSETLQLDVSMTVILPQKRNIPPHQTLYLLHGLSCDHTWYTRNYPVERWVAGYNLAVIMPFVDRYIYTNMHYGQRWFDFYSEELPNICRNVENRRKE